MEPVILVGIGGAIGAVFRFEFSKIPAWRGVPLGTFAVNALGSCAFAVLVFSQEPDEFMYLLGIGCLGGFTTFSTFSYETFRMLENHDYYTMVANIILNVTGSLLGVLLAYGVVLAAG